MRRAEATTRHQLAEVGIGQGNSRVAPERAPADVDARRPVTRGDRVGRTDAEHRPAVEAHGGPSVLRWKRRYPRAGPCEQQRRENSASHEGSRPPRGKRCAVAGSIQRVHRAEDCRVRAPQTRLTVGPQTLIAPLSTGAYGRAALQFGWVGCTLRNPCIDARIDPRRTHRRRGLRGRGPEL